MHPGWHVITVSQLFMRVPQLAGGGQVVKFGVQPQTLAVPPPPQVIGAVQGGPHMTLPPQPSGTIPQFSPPVHSVAAVPGMQQTFGVSPCATSPPQVAGGVQAGPQLTAVPQLLVKAPQFALTGQVVKFGVHPHAFGLVTVPQVSGGVHVPQAIIPPQPSATIPQSSPGGQAVRGVQPHWKLTPAPPQVRGGAQVPQLRRFPQPSGGLPQRSLSEVHVAGTHGPAPHWLVAPPPPHTIGGVQVPQARVPPQPSGSIPQVAWSSAHVVGVQPHWFADPPPPQVCGAAHAPQSRVVPQPDGADPQVCPRVAHVVGVQESTGKPDSGSLPESTSDPSAVSPVASRPASWFDSTLESRCVTNPESWPPSGSGPNCEQLAQSPLSARPQPAKCNPSASVTQNHSREPYPDVRPTALVEELSTPS